MGYDPALAIDSKTQWEEYRKLAGTKGIAAAQAGNVTEAMPKATSTIDAEYTLPYLAHAPMEPLNCSVKITKDKCEIWTGTQMPGKRSKRGRKDLGFYTGTGGSAYRIFRRRLWTARQLPLRFCI